MTQVSGSILLTYRAPESARHAVDDFWLF